ncbi:PAAR domain-containing protein, partial [Aggregatibacter actinomycetemcomitans]|uniref:hypothetical protein n=1 Tax=Aggregatibacter actinomycetemcomitans TaxID=714 RepID=UPI00197C7215
RHYSDLNLHIVTQNYQEGESVEAVIEYDSEQEKETLNVFGTVNKDGIAVVKNVFNNKLILTNEDYNG